MACVTKNMTFMHPITGNAPLNTKNITKPLTAKAYQKLANMIGGRVTPLRTYFSYHSNCHNSILQYRDSCSTHGTTSSQLSQHLGFVFSSMHTGLLNSEHILATSITHSRVMQYYSHTNLLPNFGKPTHTFVPC